MDGWPGNLRATLVIDDAALRETTQHGHYRWPGERQTPRSSLKAKFRGLGCAGVCPRRGVRRYCPGSTLRSAAAHDHRKPVPLFDLSVHASTVTERRPSRSGKDKPDVTVMLPAEPPDLNPRAARALWALLPRAYSP